MNNQDISRRDFVKACTAGAILAAGTAERNTRRDQPMKSPVAFVSHGAPPLALDPVKGKELETWARSLPVPRAILVISAHWEETPVVVGTAAPQGLIYDFRGFDSKLYEVQYPAPGSGRLASRVAAALGASQRQDRQWDHGVWVPLVCMWPEASVPVLQISLPSDHRPKQLWELGAKLRPLRDEGVQILASGGMVHNLRGLNGTDDSVPPDWATAFEEWVRESLRTWDVDSLLDYQRKAPDLGLAHPTVEHFLPFLVALGAADESDSVSFPIEGFEYGSLSRTSVQFG